MGDLLALVVLVMAALPITLLFCTRVEAIFAAAAVTGVIATIAGILHVATNLPITPVWLALTIVGSGIVFATPGLRRSAITNLREPIPLGEILQLAVVAVIVLFVVSFPPAPLAWDARSIWFFHASWLDAPASAFIEGQTLEAVEFSHPNYPILGPASMAVSWGLAGLGENLVLAEQVAALLAILIAALAGSVVVRRFARNGNTAVSTIAFALFVISALTIGDGLIVHGYMDALQACFVVALLALLVSSIDSPLTPARAVLVTIVAIGASNVKQEGFWFSVIVIVAFLMVSARRQYLVKYLPLAGVLTFYGAWKVFLAAIGASDETDASGILDRLPELINPTSDAWTIITRIASRELMEWIAPLIALSVLFLLGAIIFAERRFEVLRACLVIALSIAGMTATVVLTYALGNTRDIIDWWLSTSFTRIFATVEHTSWFGVFFGVLVISPWRGALPSRLQDQTLPSRAGS